jgi:hypothetical protein
MIEQKQELYKRLAESEALFDLGRQEPPDLSRSSALLTSVFNQPIETPETEAKVNRLILEKLSRLVRLMRDSAGWSDDNAIWSAMKMSVENSELAAARWPKDNPVIFTSDEANPRKQFEFLSPKDGHGPRWKTYSSHLIDRRKRSREEVDSLQGEISQIIKAVPKPTLHGESKAHSVLVVGYTQSGKTQNFLGLASWLADAGYRLIIILSGRTEILGAQTQRRVDRDLVGAGGAEQGDLLSEYGETELRTSFSVNPEIPHGRAWKSLSKLVDGKHTLSIGGLDPLSSEISTTYVVVCKKTRGDLNELVKWAKQQGDAGRFNWPTIFIDEEADDASPDTKQSANQYGWMEKDEASFVHGRILELRDVFKIRTYIGYTATPYANVLADPDSEGLFPDAIYVMKMPQGYFGSHKVFDILAEQPTNEQFHVREVTVSSTSSADEARIQAIKSWLVAGVLKDFRRLRRGDYVGKLLRHHSLLVNVAASKEDHNVEFAAFKRLLDSPIFSFSQNTPQVIAEMLWQWFQIEFDPVSRQMISNGLMASVNDIPPLSLVDLPTQENFRQTAIMTVEFLRAKMQTSSHADDYLLQIVNSSPGTNEPNYDSSTVDRDRGLWIILIGGNKLSRGFTVEGLTTTYFGRNSRTVDTMLQQARWNGFRLYSEDLVRLYFKRDPRKADDQQPLALFRGAALTEANSRLALVEYSVDGGLSPKEFLPKVSSVGKQAPTNRAKMRGAISNNGFTIGKVWGLGLSQRKILDDIVKRAQTNAESKNICDCQLPDFISKSSAFCILSRSDVLELYDSITSEQKTSPVLRQNLERVKGKWIGVIEQDTNPTSVRKPTAKTEHSPLHSQIADVELKDGTWHRAVDAYAGGTCPHCGHILLRDVAGTILVASNLYLGFASNLETEPAKPVERQYGMRVKLSDSDGYVSGRSRAQATELKA